MGSFSPPLPLLVIGLLPLSESSFTTLPPALLALAVAVLLYGPNVEPGVTVTGTKMVAEVSKARFWPVASKLLSPVFKPSKALFTPISALLIVPTVKLAPANVVDSGSETCTELSGTSPLLRTTML